MEETRHISAYRQSLRQRILDTAMQAFVAQGIKAVRMDDIAQKLGISKRTLYEIYENKEVLLFEGLKKAYAIDERKLMRVAAESKNVMDIIFYAFRRKIEALRSINPAFYSDLERYPQLLAFLDEERRRDQRQILGFFSRGVAEGIFRSDIDYELVWSDEFDSEEIDPEKWDFQYGDGSYYGVPFWGNNEKEYYTNRNMHEAGSRNARTNQKTYLVEEIPRDAHVQCGAVDGVVGCQERHPVEL